MKYYPNSNFKTDTYHLKDSFKEQLMIARKAGVFVNEVRKLNNLPYARKLKGSTSLREIFEDNRADFKVKYAKKLRPSIIESIDSFLGCGDFTKGFSYYECPKCGDFHIVAHTCKSRFCPKCGKKLRDKIALNVAKKLLKISHRQLVFTIPFELRKYFRLERKFLSDIFTWVKDVLYMTLKDKAKIKFREEKRQLGFISFIHTYGRDLKWHPHIHVLFAESFMTKDGEFKKFDFLPFEYIRKSFLYYVVKMMRKSLKGNEHYDEFKRDVDIVLARLKDGTYFYGKKTNFESSTRSMKKLALYLSRYCSHPSLSERRILSYNKETKEVTWFYDPHEDDTQEDEEKKLGRQIITESAESFISKLIIHIQDKGFQSIRYYGFYSNKSKIKPKSVTKLFSNANLEEYILRLERKFGILYAFGFNPLLCKCGTEMEYRREMSYIPSVDDST